MTLSRRTLFTLTAALGLVGCTSGTTSTPGASSGGGVGLDESTLASLVAALPQLDGRDLDAVRLGDGLLPPTNRWFSGLVFGTQLLPVFPLPYSFRLSDTGFEVGLPTVTAAEKTIMGSHVPQLPVALPAAPSWKVTAYDTATVTLTDATSGGTVVLGQGSPFVTFTATSATTLTLSGVSWAADGDRWAATVGSTRYVLVGDGLTVTGSSVAVAAGGRATFFAVPTGGDAGTLAALAVPLKGSSVTYSVTDTQASTTLTYTTEGDAQTAHVALPHHAASGTTLGTYASVLGTLTVVQGNDLTWTSPVYRANAGLDLSGLTDAEKSELKQQLATDVANDPAYPADTYFGGKALYRDAQLWSIATALGATDEATTLRDRIVETMDNWMDPSRCSTQNSFCFYYDKTNHGIIGNTVTFDADLYNDHHFHYGYFLYAAGVMAANDSALATKWAPVMNLLAADIASPAATSYFPQWRNFDVYSSHSWASGVSAFADGNNQESASEAVNAWAGLTLWARAVGNDELAAQASWMHALEGQAARAYWTDFDTSDPVYSGFGHHITPLVWGGKRDYATWFSAEPAALMAILVIPGSPSSGHLAGDPARIRTNVAEATATGGFDQTYGDYLLMYSALAGETDRATALETARTVSDAAIDDGDSRTYLLAFLMSNLD